MTINDAVAARITRILGKCSDYVEVLGQWRWNCALQNGSRRNVDVSAADEFLELAADLDGMTPDLATVLRRIETLPGTARFALKPRTNALCMKADVVIQDDLLPTRVADALRGIHEGCEWLGNAGADDSSQQSAESHAERITLAERLSETPWSTEEHGPNEFLVDLERPSRQRARLTLDRLGVDAKVELMRTDAATVLMRQALAVLLLTANGALRLVRAYSAGSPILSRDREREVVRPEDKAASESNGLTAFGFQARLASDCTALELDHALAALSTACSLCSREMNALLDETIAGYYLSIRGLPLNNHQSINKEN